MKSIREYLTRERRALEHLQDAERKALNWKAAERLWRSTWFRWEFGGIIVLMVCMFTVGAVLRFWKHGPIGLRIAAPLLLYLSPIALALLYNYLRGLPLRRRQLSIACITYGIRPRICLICGYDLRAIGSETCPECGTTLAPAEDTGRRALVEEHAQWRQMPWPAAIKWLIDLLVAAIAWLDRQWWGRSKALADLLAGPRDAAITRASDRVTRAPTPGRCGIPLIIGAFAEMVIAGVFARTRNPVEGAAATLGVIAALVWYLIYRHRRMKPLLAAELETGGLRPARCLLCRYDLHGSTSDTCPECGASLAAVTGETAGAATGRPPLG